MPGREGQWTESCSTAVRRSNGSGTAGRRSAGLVDADHPRVLGALHRSSSTIERDQAPVDATDEIADRWDASPIRRAAPHLVEQLAEAGRDAGLLAIVTDAAGQVLWESAPRRAAAARPRGSGWCPGGHWDETAAGTNGIGMALVTGRPAAVFATEHWCEPVRDWVCYSAPVHAPDGSVAGVIDLSTTWDRANPLGLRHGRRVRPADGGRAGRRRDARRPRRSRPARRSGGPGRRWTACRWRSTRRQIELLVVARHRRHGDARRAARPAVRRPAGQPDDAAGRDLPHPGGARRGDRVAAVPLDRARTGSTPSTCSTASRRGDLAGAVERYDGQLLPASDAPLIVERRYHLDVALRTALLLGGSTAQLLRFGRVHPSDVEVLERAVSVAGPGDPELPAAVAALAVATADLAT